mmetsp:Transcript_43463/g.68852  ORF Transcript_43463/g.68852 Transcript_43463/m.68852 type:complete len:305 (+) Transcript_43463:114-1028(+)
MGCSGSKEAGQPTQAPPPQQVQVGMILDQGTSGGGGGGSGGKGKGGGKGGKKKPDKKNVEKKFQIKLDGHWKDYGDEEDRVLKRAYMVGNSEVKYCLRDQYYKYDFQNWKQINESTGKTRDIRRPYGFPPPPKASILPTGPMVVVKVKAGQPGQMITVPDPNNPGQSINVFVPPTAKVGSKMAVPVPKKGESVSDVQAKQKKHQEEQKASGKWSTGGKIAASGAALVAVGAVGVGGVVLGDHLAGGDMAETIADTTVDVAEDVGEAIGDFAEDAIDWMGDAGEDAIDWLGDAGEDVGDFIMDLF